jgi:predicted nucleic acid-binding protein
MDGAIVDTDILSEVLKRRNPNVVRHAAADLRRESQFANSAITRFELLRGVMERVRPPQRVLVTCNSKQYAWMLGLRRETWRTR